MNKEATGRTRGISESDDRRQETCERPIPYNLRKRPRSTQRVAELDLERNEPQKRSRTGIRPRRRKTRTECRQDGRGRRQQAASSHRSRNRYDPETQSKSVVKLDSVGEEERLRKMLRGLGHAVVDVCSCASQEERRLTFEALEYFLDLLGHSSLGEESVFVTALALLDKIILSKNPITITPHRVCELFCGLTLLASKFLRDMPTWNWEASRLVSLERIHQVEFELLDCLDWNVWVSEGEFSQYRAMITR